MLINVLLCSSEKYQRYIWEALESSCLVPTSKWANLWAILARSSPWFGSEEVKAPLTIPAKFCLKYDCRKHETSTSSNASISYRNQECVSTLNKFKKALGRPCPAGIARERYVRISCLSKSSLPTCLQRRQCQQAAHMRTSQCCLRMFHFLM